MKLYFVRHGESTFNQLKLHQHGKVELSEYGQKQAQKVAKRFTTIPIELIISSPMTRALQTAEEIQKITNKKLIEVDLLREVKKPSIFEGKSLIDPALSDIKELIKENFENPKWYHSDEENFSDLKKRAAEFLEHISAYSEQNIAVVTHGDFLRIIIGIIVFGDNFTTDLYYQFQKHMVHNNTGITMCEKIDEKQWKVLTWNDHAHLG